jgi:hypothetical protein
VGWFGPRGLASVVFALLALEEIGQPAASQAVAVITVTALLSVVVHARPPIRWHGGSGHGLPRPPAALNTPACRMCRSAGSSAGHPPQPQGPARIRSQARPGLDDRGVITGTGFQRGTRCAPTRRGTGAVARYHLPGMNRCAGAPA